MTAARRPYKRILLKLSGEALMGDDSYGINRAVIERIVGEIGEVVALGVQVAIVIGGGNIFRGVAPAAAGMDRATADYMGMLATSINALALQDVMEHYGIPTRVQSAIAIPPVAEPFIRRRCIRHLEKGRVVILAAGTGSPFVTTDTAAALRAREIDADLVVKATRVDGVYSDDPLKNPHAVRYSEISYQDVLRQNLQVMDAQAIHHCMEHNIPIVVLNYQKSGNIERVIAGERLGTRVGAPAT